MSRSRGCAGRPKRRPEKHLGLPLGVVAVLFLLGAVFGVAQELDMLARSGRNLDWRYALPIVILLGGMAGSAWLFHSGRRLR